MPSAPGMLRSVSSRSGGSTRKARSCAMACWPSASSNELETQAGQLGRQQVAHHITVLCQPQPPAPAVQFGQGASCRRRWRGAMSASQACATGRLSCRTRPQSDGSSRRRRPCARSTGGRSPAHLLVGLSGAQAQEGLENRRQLPGCHAWAVIADGEDQLERLVRCRAGGPAKASIHNATCPWRARSIAWVSSSSSTWRARWHRARRRRAASVEPASRNDCHAVRPAGLPARRCCAARPPGKAAVAARRQLHARAGEFDQAVDQRQLLARELSDGQRSCRTAPPAGSRQVEQAMMADSGARRS